MKRRFRLTRSTDFQRVRRIGKSYAHPLVVLILAPNNLDQLRVGVVAGRALGNAVERNRAKRRLRACLDKSFSSLVGGWDVVFLARKAINQAEFQEIDTAIQGLFRKAGMLNDRA